MRHIDRRTLLAWSVQLPILGLAVRQSRAACVDPAELSDSVQGMRESLEYTDAAADQKQTCAGCSFFKPDKPTASCGNCEVLAGPVSSKGHCVSWTKKS